MANMHPMLARMAELLVHHYNQASAMGRTAAAKGLGLDNPENYGHPYPGSNTITNVFNMGGETEKTTAVVSNDGSGTGVGQPPVVMPPVTPPATTPPAAQSPATTTPVVPSAAATPPADGGRGWLQKLLLLVMGAGAGSLLAWLLLRPGTPATPPAGQPLDTTNGTHGHGIVYEVYEREDDQPWQRSKMTVEELLGIKRPKP